ncbi:hypothetical protein ADUPG1_010952 [Aduncisulcus paluster]|uniref:Uncharacterized protein n=1 Tax=Aduncisulcus paluster TaxID=2918883 RepID=A0ABQ5JTJ2_9EUKA|nr:hypothetical protein ADUPG1_010952 [Aduncisulcus paluster]
MESIRQQNPILEILIKFISDYGQFEASQDEIISLMKTEIASYATKRAKSVAPYSSFTTERVRNILAQHRKAYSQRRQKYFAGELVEAAEYEPDAIFSEEDKEATRKETIKKGGILGPDSDHSLHSTSKQSKSNPLHVEGLEPPKDKSHSKIPAKLKTMKPPSSKITDKDISKTIEALKSLSSKHESVPITSITSLLQSPSTINTIVAKLLTSLVEIIPKSVFNCLLFDSIHYAHNNEEQRKKTLAKYPPYVARLELERLHGASLQDGITSNIFPHLIHPPSTISGDNDTFKHQTDQTATPHPDDTQDSVPTTSVAQGAIKPVPAPHSTHSKNLLWRLPLHEDSLEFNTALPFLPPLMLSHKRERYMSRRSVRRQMWPGGVDARHDPPVVLHDTGMGIGGPVHVDQYIKYGLTPDGRFAEADGHKKEYVEQDDIEETQRIKQVGEQMRKKYNIKEGTSSVPSSSAQHYLPSKKQDTTSLSVSPGGPLSKKPIPFVGGGVEHGFERDDSTVFVAPPSPREPATPSPSLTPSSDVSDHGEVATCVTSEVCVPQSHSPSSSSSSSSSSSAETPQKRRFSSRLRDSQVEYVLDMQRRGLGVPPPTAYSHDSDVFLIEILKDYVGYTIRPHPDETVKSVLLRSVRENELREQKKEAQRLEDAMKLEKRHIEELKTAMDASHPSAPLDARDLSTQNKHRLTDATGESDCSEKGLTSSRVSQSSPSGTSIFSKNQFSSSSSSTGIIQPITSVRPIPGPINTKNIGNKDEEEDKESDDRDSHQWGSGAWSRNNL